MNMPGFWRDSLARAVAYGQLGELEAAEKALQELLAVRPNFASQARQECEKWWQPELADSLLEGLRKAGLEIPEAGTSASRKISTSLSRGEARDSGASRHASELAESPRDLMPWNYCATLAQANIVA